MEQRSSGFRFAAALMLLVMAAAACFSFSWSRQGGIREIQNSEYWRIAMISNGVFAPADKLSYLPKVVSRYALVEDALTHPENARHIQSLNELLTQLNADAGSTVIYLLDLDGTAIASSNWKGPESFIGQNYGFRPYFSDALRKGEGTFYAMGLTSKTPGYYVSAPVRKKGVAIGVAVVKIDLNNLSFAYSGSGHEMMATDENGIVFLSSREEWKYRPMSPLTAAIKQQLKDTRQYEGVLKAPLAIEIRSKLSGNERIISLAHGGAGRGGGKEASYFMHSRALPESTWKVHILTPLKEVERQAKRDAAIGAGAVALLFLLFMQIKQLRMRSEEKRQSRRVLEQAYRSLEEKHGEVQAANEELRIQSITDSLTSVFNRRFFLDATAKMLSSANRHAYPVAVLMIDIDHFKEVNDVHGHLAGDKVLKSVAAMYKEELREGDILARFGGEEFIIAFPHTDAKMAQVVAERIRIKIMDRRIEVDGAAIKVTISGGISQHRLGETNIQETIKRADVALYKAKAGGRNQIVLALPGPSGTGRHF